MSFTLRQVRINGNLNPLGMRPRVYDTFSARKTRLYSSFRLRQWFKYRCELDL